jgi:hypothetical protein
MTCEHLISEGLPDRVGGWYGACDLGDAAARVRWLQQRRAASDATES